MPSRIIIFDDNKQRLKSVSMLINTTTDLVCVSEFLNTADIIEKIKTTQPDLVLMDIDMPGGDGISATKILRTFYPDLIVIMQTIFELAGRSQWLFVKENTSCQICGVSQRSTSGRSSYDSKYSS